MHTTKNPQPQPQSQSMQCPQNNPKTFDIQDRYSEQIRLCKELDRKMERLNEKYNLDCFSSSELDSESDEVDYRYEHKYKTLI